jgi:hypothetical protein
MEPLARSLTLTSIGTMHHPRPMKPSSTQTVVCPGCALELPGSPDDATPRPGASAACWQLYGEVAGYETQHVAQLGRFHQLMVDAYAAQHPAENGPPIGLAFALIGLHLAIDEDWRGDQVRDVHRALAGRATDWPRFAAPAERAPMTVFDVAMAGSPQAHAELVQAWAAEVWETWRDHRPTVIALLGERLPSEVRARIRSG